MKFKNSSPAQARCRKAAKRVKKAWMAGVEIPGTETHYPYLLPNESQDQRRRRAGWKAHRAAEWAWAQANAWHLVHGAGGRKAAKAVPTDHAGWVAHNAACGTDD